MFKEDKLKRFGAKCYEGVFGEWGKKVSGGSVGGGGGRDCAELDLQISKLKVEIEQLKMQSTSPTSGKNFDSSLGSPINR